MNDGSQPTYQVNSETLDPLRSGDTASTYSNNTATTDDDTDITIGSTTQTVAFTNTYPDAITLNLRKIVDGQLPSSMGENPKFIFTVTLKSANGVDLSGYTSLITLPDGSMNTTDGTAYPANSKLNAVTPDDGNYTFDVAVPVYNSTNSDATTVKITGLPIGITYSVAEKTSSGVVQYMQKDSNDAYNLASHPANTGLTTKYSLNNTDYVATALTDVSISSNNAYVKNIYPAVHTLTLKKALNGEENAKTTVNGSTNFVYEVTLSNSTIDLREYLSQTEMNDLDIGDAAVSIGQNSCTIHVNVTEDGTDPVIHNIPHGTTYTVTEKYANTSGSSTVYEAISNDPNNPHVDYGTAGATSISAALNADVEATVTNSYRQITLTKTDSEDGNTTVNGATYKLYRLKSTTTENAFLAAITSDGLASALTTYCDEVMKPDDTTPFTAATAGGGQIVVKDGDISGGITDGKYVFVEQSAPSTGYYTMDNNLSDKIIEVSSTNDTDASYTFYDADYAYKVDHSDPRQTASLELTKSLAAGTKQNDSAEGTANKAQTFTYTVTLESTDVDLTKFILEETITGNGNGQLGGAFTKTDGTNNDYSASKIQFTVPVSKNVSKTLTGVPYGTKYTVTEAMPESSTWKQVDDNGKVTNITISSSKVVFFICDRFKMDFFAQK